MGRQILGYRPFRPGPAGGQGVVQIGTVGRVIVAGEDVGYYAIALVPRRIVGRRELGVVRIGGVEGGELAGLKDDRTDGPGPALLRIFRPIANHGGDPEFGRGGLAAGLSPDGQGKEFVFSGRKDGHGKEGGDGRRI
jgi:hypothetical protein